MGSRPEIEQKNMNIWNLKTKSLNQINLRYWYPSLNNAFIEKRAMQFSVPLLNLINPYFLSSIWTKTPVTPVTTSGSFLLMQTKYGEIC